MTTKPADQLTPDEAVLWLAELEWPCPDRDNEGDPDGAHALGCFGDCHGTGQVPKYPMLRGPCPCLHHRFDKDSYDARRHSGYCTGNLCPGWLPVTTTDALLEAGKPQRIAVAWDEDRKLWVGKARRLGGGVTWVVPLEATGDSPQEALARALVQAMRAGA